MARVLNLEENLKIYLARLLKIVRSQKIVRCLKTVRFREKSKFLKIQMLFWEAAEWKWNLLDQALRLVPKVLDFFSGSNGIGFSTGR